jgi:hypothetical protein
MRVLGVQAQCLQPSVLGATWGGFPDIVELEQLPLGSLYKALMEEYRATAHQQEAARVMAEEERDQLRADRDQERQAKEAMQADVLQLWADRDQERQAKEAMEAEV